MWSERQIRRQKPFALKRTLASTYTKLVDLVRGVGNARPDRSRVAASLFCAAVRAPGRYSRAD
jgi:hypothetical protein